jgi:hypothetical protein
VESSSIRAIGYDEVAGELWVEFHSSPDPYVYLEVPRKVATTNPLCGGLPYAASGPNRSGLHQARGRRVERFPAMHREANGPQ